MKVFISWSGERSNLVANLLSDWLKKVLQATQPWVSNRDIDRGALWFSEINSQLKDTSIGIICLTQENKQKPWILFEAGALAKGLSSNKVCTFLVDLESSDVTDPLAQFNHTTPHKDDFKNLVHTLNNTLGENALEQNILDNVFETYWPQFNEGFKNILKNTENIPAPKPRSNDDILEEILNSTRALNHKVRRLEDEVGMVRSSDGSLTSYPSKKTGILSFGENYFPANQSGIFAQLAELAATARDVDSKADTQDGKFVSDEKIK